MLTTDDFPAFFKEVYGYDPFPWQTRLLRRVAGAGEWPRLLDLPTGSGKTAAIDIAVFHLALEAARGAERRAPVRIAFVVDRRLVVDDAFERARKLEQALAARAKPVTSRVADALKTLSGSGPPLMARRLRGGTPREGDWARTPSQPTVLCSTVDQVGSRLLFRGYGVSDSMKPVHAGLIGSDCLILLDEAHLAEPFRQTLGWVRVYRSDKWREAEEAAPWSFAVLTATPGSDQEIGFALEEVDRTNPILEKRLKAEKRAFLVQPAKGKAKPHEEDGTEDEEQSQEEEARRRVDVIVEHAGKALAHFENPAHGAPHPAVGVVVNRVARARAVFKKLKEALKERIGSEEIADPVLLIGPARPADRDTLAKISLDPIRTRTWKDGESRTLEKPLLIVATQCIEAGVDIDLDALVTEAAPLDALRQRFGRLNRAGRSIEPYAAIAVMKSDLSARADDPVYGAAVKLAWDYLNAHADKPAGRKAQSIFDFALNAFEELTKFHPIPDGALSEKPDAPVLLPAHLDLLSQTSPIPAADPEVALYLHGPLRQPDSVTVTWRADIDPELHNDEEDIRRLLTIVPPRTGEAIELPVWTVRRWLTGNRKGSGDIADIATKAPDRDEGKDGRQIFRWRGNNEGSRWIGPADLRPGDSIVVPARYGGVDEHGWNPESQEPATDLAQKAAMSFAERRFAVRVAPGLLVEPKDKEAPEDRKLREQQRADALAETLASVESRHWKDVCDALSDLPLSEEIRTALDRLEDVRGKNKGAPIVIAYRDLYRRDDRGRPRGVVFLAPLGLKSDHDEPGKSVDITYEEEANSTEDDASGSLPGFTLSLEQHSRDVESEAEALATAAGLSEARVADLKLAGFLHDAGKADPRFQAWLNYGDALGPDPENAEALLAKSGRPLPRKARAASGLPENWRHEALSVRLALQSNRLGNLPDASDPELALWLIGVHHGHGRPLFPHADLKDGDSRENSSVLRSLFGLPEQLAAAPGPQSLGFDWNGLDWPSLFARLKTRYGVWELARMEAILRLADHRASQDARNQILKESTE